MSTVKKYKVLHHINTLLFACRFSRQLKHTYCVQHVNGNTTVRLFRSAKVLFMCTLLQALVHLHSPLLPLVPPSPPPPGAAIPSSPWCRHPLLPLVPPSPPPPGAAIPSSPWCHHPLLPLVPPSPPPPGAAIPSSPWCRHPLWKWTCLCALFI